MSMKLFNTHMHTHTKHNASSGLLTRLAGSTSLLNINKKYRARKERSQEKTKKESTFWTLVTLDAFRILEGP